MRLRTWLGFRGARWLAIAGAAALVLVTASVALAGSGSNLCPCWTKAEVLKATGTHQVVPVYAVPKKHTRYTLAFIHLDETTPTFATWVVAMKAAAKFYGVNLIQTQEAPHGDEVLPQLYAQLQQFHPAVVGAQHATQALLDATSKDGVPLFGLDSTVIPGIYHMGAPDKQAGRLGADNLGPALKQAMAGKWKGRPLYYLGLDYIPCQPCEDRVNAGFAEIQKYVKIPASHEILVSTAQNPDQVESQVATILTAHPTAVFAALSLNDEWGIGGFEAAKAANRQKDMLGVTLGCDSAGVGALKDKSNSGMDLGCVNFNAWAEGWNWVEAAIAIAIGKEKNIPIHFKNYAINQFVPVAKVNTYFPNG